MCGFTDEKNRNGRVFLCLPCWYLAHADRNAAHNVEDAEMRNLGRPARRGKLALRAKHTISDFPATPARSIHVKGCLDAEFLRWFPDEPSSTDWNVAVRDGNTLA